MINNKFIGKYMRIAKQVGLDSNPCHSRKIGVIIVDELANRIMGTGYNGPPAGTPHCDDYDYLRNFFWPQLTEAEKNMLVEKTGFNHPNNICEHYHNCGTCPRRLVNAASGERSELCSCQHAERNAITNAAQDVLGCTMFCWCGIPCIQCTGSIINAGITTVYCLKAPDYHPVSRWLFEQRGIQIIENTEEYYETLK